jgi:hypothetical protein
MPAERAVVESLRKAMMKNPDHAKLHKDIAEFFTPAVAGK